MQELCEGPYASPVWTNWIREETNAVMNQLEEELIARGDPEDPFNRSANGIFHPLLDIFSLSPPVQMPRRQKDISKPRKSSRKLPKKNSNRE